MSNTCRLVILIVLIYSTAVSSNSFDDLYENKCRLGSLNLCSSLSTQDDQQITNNVVDKNHQDLAHDEMSCATCSMLTLKIKGLFESTKRKSNGYKINELQQSSKFHLEHQLKLIQTSSEVYEEKETWICKTCKLALKNFLNVFQHDDKDEIRRSLLHSCRGLDEMKSECEEMVKTHFESIAILVTKISNANQICKAIKICKEENFEIETNFFKGTQQVLIPTPSVNCRLGAICEIVLTKIKQIIDTEDKRDKVMNAMLLTCDIWPDFIRIPCHTMVESVGFPFLHLLNSIDPHGVCHIFHTNTNQAVVEDF